MKLSLRSKNLIFFLLTFCYFFVSTNAFVYAQGVNHDLSDSSEWNYRFDGAAASDLIGWAIYESADVNNNGISDVIFPARGADYNSLSGSGSVYIIYDTRLTGGIANDFDLNDSSSYNLRIDGEFASGQFGRDMSVGDVDGDGKLELVVSAYNASNGYVYIIPNSVLNVSGTGNTISVSDNENYSYRINGAASGHQLGYGSAVIADINGDSKNDMAVLAPGADYNSRSNSGSLYIIDNSLISDVSTGNTLDMADTNDFTVRFDGPAATSFTTFAILNKVSIDGDNKADLAISDNWALSSRGATWILSDDKITPYNNGAVVDLATATNYTVRFEGRDTSTHTTLSYSVTDLDDDNYSELYFGSADIYYLSDSALAEYANSSGENVVLNSSVYTALLSGVSEFRGYGDFDGDGIVDLFLNDPGASNNGLTSSGSVWIVPGNNIVSLSGNGNTIDITSPTNYIARFDGEASNIASRSHAKSFAPDFNGDGKVDFYGGIELVDNNSRANSGSMYIVLNFPHSLTAGSTAANSITTVKSATVTGNISAPNSTTNISGVQWSESNNPLGTWNECTADDGGFNSTNENYTCNVSMSKDGLKNIYVRAYDENTSYTAQSNYGSISFTLDSEPPSDKVGNTDFEVIKMSDNDLPDEKGTPKLRVPKDKLSIKFEQIKDETSGIDHYEIRLTKTHSTTLQKKDNDYAWIEDIDAKQPTHSRVRTRNGFEIWYENNRINVKLVGDKLKLDDGWYYLMIRAYDKAGNHIDSDEVLMEVVDGDTVNSDSILTLTNIGQIPYTSDYSTYYYTSNQMTLMGTVDKETEIRVYVDGNEIHKDTYANTFKITNGLINGTRKVRIEGGQTPIEFTLIIDPTRQSFPASLQ